MTDAIRILIKQGATVRCVRLNPEEQRYDIGTPLTYYKAFTDFALRDSENAESYRAYLNEKLKQ